jgi:methionyl-tRNA formyltransferase
MRAIVFGNRELGCVCLETLLDLEVEVPLVVTYPRDPAEAPGFRCLAEVAASRGVPVATPPDASGRPLLDWVRALRPDVLFSFYYGHRIGRSLRRVPPLGAFNVHGALLPRWRGRAPLPWVILEGDDRCGVTLHEMVEEMDAGDIVAQVSFPVGPRDTSTTLYARMLDSCRTLLRQTVPLIAQNRAPRTPQIAALATVAPPLMSRRLLDRKASLDRFDRTVRAFATPYPGALVPMGGRRVILWTGERGEDGPGIHVPVADGTYRVLRLGLEGGPPLDHREFLAAHPEAADLLGVGPG